MAMVNLWSKAATNRSSAWGRVYFSTFLGSKMCENRARAVGSHSNLLFSHFQLLIAASLAGWRTVKLNQSAPKMVAIKAGKNSKSSIKSCLKCSACHSSEEVVKLFWVLLSNVMVISEEYDRNRNRNNAAHV